MERTLREHLKARVDAARRGEAERARPAWLALDRYMRSVVDGPPRKDVICHRNNRNPEQGSSAAEGADPEGGSAPAPGREVLRLR